MYGLNAESEISDDLYNQNLVIFRRVRVTAECLLSLFHASIFIHKTPKESPDGYSWNLILESFIKFYRAIVRSVNSNNHKNLPAFLQQSRAKPVKYWKGKSFTQKL